MNTETQTQESTQSAEFRASFKQLQESVHKTALEKGWWDLRKKMVISAASQRHAINDLGEPDLVEFAVRSNQITCIALIITELSEAIEAIRNGNPPDDKIPEFCGAEAECADAIIRIMDASEAYGWDVAGAIIRKAEMNKGRQHMHGKKI